MSDTTRGIDGNPRPGVAVGVTKRRARLADLATLLRLARVELRRKGSVSRCSLHDEERLTGGAPSLQPQPPDR
jgi:hypothetical protein